MPATTGRICPVYQPSVSTRAEQFCENNKIPASGRMPQDHAAARHNGALWDRDGACRSVFGALHISTGSGIYLDLVADINKQRHFYFRPGFNSRIFHCAA